MIGFLAFGFFDYWICLIGMFRFFDVWIFGFLEVWILGSLGFWILGMFVWMFGFWGWFFFCND